MAPVFKLAVAAFLFCTGSCEYDAGVASLTSADASLDDGGAEDKSVQKGDAVGAFVATDAAEEDEKEEAAGAEEVAANSSVQGGGAANASAAMTAAEEDELEEAAGDADDDEAGEDEDGNLVQRGSYNPIHKIFKPCRGYCVSCDGENEFWHVKRSKSGITKLALAATVAGILATGGLAGGYVVAHGLAGTIGNLFVISGIKMSSAAIAGLTGATYLTYNLITRNVDCPRLEFIEMHKFPPAQTPGEDGEKKPVPKEMRYSLEDVFFEELASQMQDVGGNEIMDTPRQDMQKSQRLQSLFACAVLKNSKINLTSVSVLLPQIKESLPQYDSLFEAMVAQCSVWLCTKRPEQVKKISKLSFRQCDGAHVFTGRWWKRQARRFGLR